MKITLLGNISGTRNGRAWPGYKSVVDLPDAEAEDLVKSGMAVKAEKGDDITKGFEDFGKAVLEAPEVRNVTPIPPDNDKTPGNKADQKKPEDKKPEDKK